MSDKQKLFLLAVIMGVVTVLVTAFTFSHMYRVAVVEELGELQESAMMQARLIEAISRFDANYIPDYPLGAREATLSQIKEAHLNYDAFGKSREFVAAILDGDTIRFIISHKQIRLEKPMAISINSQLAKPMHLALQGLSGTIISNDYDGNKVLAAYEPVEFLDIGIVIQVDQAEFRRPFIRSGILISTISLIIILAAAFFFRKVSSPIIHRLKSYSENLEQLVERRTTELTASEQKFRGIFENAPIPSFTINLEGKILDINTAGAYLMQIEQEEIRSGQTNITSILSSTQWEVIKAQIKNTGILNNYQLDIKQLDSISIPCDVSASSLEQTDSGLQTYLLIIRDLTDEIDYSELKWKNEVLDKLKMAFYELTMECGKKNPDDLDITGCVKNLSKLCYGIVPMRAIAFFIFDEKTDQFLNTGLFTNEIDLQTLKSAFPGFSGSMHFSVSHNPIMEKAIHGKDIQYVESFEFMGHNPNIQKHRSVYQNCQVALIPIQPHGETWGLMCVVSEKYMPVESLFDDIRYQVEMTVQYLHGILTRNTDQRKIEELASFPLNNPTPIIACDLQGNITYSNNACLKTLEACQLNSDNYYELLPKNYITDAMEKFKTGSTRCHFEISVGDSHFLWSANIVPSIFQIHFYATDVTELKQTQVSLISAKNKAETANRLKSHFLQNISHEIRTPLNAIIGYSDLIATVGAEKLNEDELFFVHAIQSGGDRLLRTMHEILDISTITAGAYEPHFQIFDIRDLLTKIEMQFTKLADEKFLAFSLTCTATHMMVNYDFNSLFFATSNLVDNAIKYTEKGSVNLNIIEVKDKLILSVIDTGLGIDEEYMGIMYDPFTQESEGISKKFQGVGLGLSIAKQYLDVNTIPVSAESKIGKGTTFQLTLKWVDNLGIS